MNKIFFCPKCLKEYDFNILRCVCGEALLYADEKECETAIPLYREGGINRVLQQFGDQILASNTPSSDSNVYEKLVEGENTKSWKGSKSPKNLGKILDEMEEEALLDKGRGAVQVGSGLIADGKIFTICIGVSALVIYIFHEAIEKSILFISKVYFDTNLNTSTNLYMAIFFATAILTYVILLGLLLRLNEALAHPLHTITNLVSGISKWFQDWQKPDRFQKFVATLSVIIGLLLSLVPLGFAIGVPLILFGVTLFFYGGFGAVIILAVAYYFLG